MTLMKYMYVTKGLEKIGVQAMAQPVNVITAVQRERGAQNSGLSEEVVDEVLQKLYSKNKYKALIKEAKENRQSLVETFGDAIAAH